MLSCPGIAEAPPQLRAPLLQGLLAEPRRHRQARLSSRMANLLKQRKVFSLIPSAGDLNGSESFEVRQAIGSQLSARSKTGSKNFHFPVPPPYSLSRGTTARTTFLDQRELAGSHSPRLWLEIGAGHGEVTRLLAATAARVIAVELDPRLHPRLRSLARQYPQIELAGGDILALDLSELTGHARFSVYGNLPYYITSPILHHLFQYAETLEDIFLVMQLEVAERIAASPGSRQFGYLSVFSQFYARPEILLRIPSGAFRPPPKVTSALIQLKGPGRKAAAAGLDEGHFFEFVKLCFAHKRKTLVNNLRTLASPDTLAATLAEFDLRADARAEQLGVAQFVEIYRRLNPG
jgi:16S rRNA (adenine1518-N6/adenine1519-N6)-dimethyltransferase